MSEGRTDDDRLSTEDEPDRVASSADSSVASSAIKACCMCGTDLHGRMRYKDSAGRYWCPNCNEKDQKSKQPAACPDCNATFTRADLIEFKGTAVCHPCWERRRMAARREEARLRAVEEEIREDEEKKKRWIMIVWIFVGVLALWGAGMLFYVLIK